MSNRSVARRRQLTRRRKVRSNHPFCRFPGFSLYACYPRQDYDEQGSHRAEGILLLLGGGVAD